MVFAYLEEIKKHASLIAFLAFAGWLAFLAVLQMAFGWGGAGESPPIPPSPEPFGGTSALDPVGRHGEPVGPSGLSDGRCLNIEGHIVCEGEA